MNSDGRAAWTHLIPLVLLWLVPVVAIAIALPLSAVRESSAVVAGQPTTIEVGSRSNDHLTGVEISIGIDQGLPVTASAAGVVTGVPIAAGQKISQGMPLLEVNYRKVLAFRAATPLYRDLKIGDSGRDVALLAKFLTKLGFLSDDSRSDHFGPNIQSAVRRLEARIGAPQTGAFSLSYVSFVPSGLTSLAEVKLRVGDKVSPGTVLAPGAPVATSFGVQTSNQQGSLSALAGDRLRILAGPDSFELSGLHPADDELPKILEFLQSAVKAGTATATPSSDGSATRFAAVRLALAQPATVGTIPGAALYVAASGKQCVFAVTRSASGFASVAVESAEPLSGEVGALAIDPALIGRTVARQPERLPDDVLATC